jgi:endonuclease YncB( thermonuclease family)
LSGKIARDAELPLAYGGAMAVLLVSLSSCGVAAPPPASFEATVAYVVDGDTLRLRDTSGDLEYVRLVGMLSRVSRPTPRLPVVAPG